MLDFYIYRAHEGPRTFPSVRQRGRKEELQGEQAPMSQHSDWGTRLLQNAPDSRRSGQLYGPTGVASPRKQFNRPRERDVWSNNKLDIEIRRLNTALDKLQQLDNAH